MINNDTDLLVNSLLQVGLGAIPNDAPNSLCTIMSGYLRIGDVK